MKKTFSAVGCERMVEGVKAEMQRLKEEAKQEESRSGKIEVERERERVEVERRCGKRVSCNVFEDFSSVTEWE